jgi:hypothetical protein
MVGFAVGRWPGMLEWPGEWRTRADFLCSGVEKPRRRRARSGRTTRVTGAMVGFAVRRWPGMLEWPGEADTPKIDKGKSGRASSGRTTRVTGAMAGFAAARRPRRRKMRPGNAGPRRVWGPARSPRRLARRRPRLGSTRRAEEPRAIRSANCTEIGGLGFEVTTAGMARETASESWRSPIRWAWKPPSWRATGSQTPIALPASVNPASTKAAAATKMSAGRKIRSPSPVLSFSVHGALVLHAKG